MLFVVTRSFQSVGLGVVTCNTSIKQSEGPLCTRGPLLELRESAFLSFFLIAVATRLDGGEERGTWRNKLKRKRGERDDELETQFIVLYHRLVFRQPSDNLLTI